ncbi:MAG: hypothetical protein KF685_03905 [Acidobacteria bacterium]|nr:hypothetical protein [Acidobacteriota bacterium]
MSDSSRHFGDLPHTADFETMREHAGKLPDAKETAYITDNITEMWLDLTYRGHKFSINNQFGEYWFFVENRDCPDEVLSEVLEHFGSLLIRPKQ